MAEERWWSCPAEGDGGRTVIVTGHDGLDSQRLSGIYNFRVDVGWDYGGRPDGMPDEEDARLMEDATEALHKELKKTKAVVMTGIYTGDGRRDWVFYTRDLGLFQSIFNRALAGVDSMPLQIEAEEDPGWEEYLEMRSGSYIPADSME